MSQTAIKARIAQLKAQGTVAPPNTWIGTTSITKKNGKRYTYYRLMTAYYPPATKDNPNPNRKTKMVQYLGSKESLEYKEMVKAIARRNEIQRLQKKLYNLEKQVSVASTQRRQRDKQSALTTLVGELVQQVQGLVEEMAWLKREFMSQFKSNPITS
ncbi:transposase [Cyanothece sp. BG0011]|uniref:transposase n=1 Tax=Cyanothece sp. BG0011 TaxID=2082950 RepID=UPI000D1D80D1|nr:transposase [Cyanothece sp. BG0011]